MRLRWLLTVLLAVVILNVLAVVVSTTLYAPVHVESRSMEPVLKPGDLLIVQRGGEPRVGDIVIFESPEDPDRMLIKRVFAVGGETIEAREGVLAREPDQRGRSAIINTQSSLELERMELPDDTVWVMGDNFDQSTDSRSFGPLPVEAVEGEAVLVVWPWSRRKSL